MKKLLCLMGGAMLFCVVEAQKITALSIGDTIPDLTFNSIVNYKAKSAKISDFKDKLIIFDFWATWCTNCLGAIPHTQSLQKQFGDSIMVMLVNSKGTRDTYENIAKLFQRQSRLKMPSITGDSVLTRLFPHREIPHYVWIYNQVVRAITSQKEITKMNIRSVLNDPTKRLPTKNDFPDFNIQGPLFTDKGVLDNIIEHSILSKYTDRFQNSHSGALRDSNKLLTCLFFTNLKLWELYCYAYPIARTCPLNRIIKATPMLDSIFCYDLQLPSSKDEVFYQRMREDLYKAFHLTVKEDVRLTRCLVVTKKGNINNLYDTTKTSESTLDEFYDQRYIHNMPMRIFYIALNGKSSIPVIDETGITGNITMDGLPDKLTDIPALKVALARYGLDINYETRKLKMCVIQHEDN